jgi:hypothetical protein
MKDITSTSFGYVIAFLLPGLIGLYGLGYFSETLSSALLSPGKNAEAAIGPFLLLMLAALIVGLLVSAARWLLFEKCICKSKSFGAGHFAKLGVGEKLTAFKAVVEEHYRYHQFYGGCAISFVVMYTGWLCSNHATVSCWRIVGWTLALTAIEAITVTGAIDSYEKYIDRGQHIVQGQTG